MFQNLRVNSQLYILHKDSNPYIEYGSIVSVSAPKPKYPAAMPPIGTMPQMEMVVDIVVNINGQDTTFQGLPAGSDVADFGNNGNIVITCSRDAMNSEVSMMKQRSTEIINSIDYHKNVIQSCDKMLMYLNPEYAAKQQQDKEMANMRSQMADMSNQMADMSKTLNTLMSKLMEQNGGSETPNKTRK